MDQGEAAVLALLTIEGMGSDDSQRKKKMKKLAAQNPDAESDIFNPVTLARYKPKSLNSLCSSTKFTRREIQLMYRGFKQECPAGIVNEEMFKNVYGQFFPQGDSAGYAHLVFKTLDKSNVGCLAFEEFLQFLSDLTYGGQEEKLRWAFDLYNQSNTGKITRTEMTIMVTAIYDMMGEATTTPIEQSAIEEHVNHVMSQASSGSNKDEISYDSFKELCLKNQQQSTSTFHEFATDLRLRN